MDKPVVAVAAAITRLLSVTDLYVGLLMQFILVSFLFRIIYSVDYLRG
jgi:hypothetical protein